MAGPVKQGEIEMVFEDLMGAEIENMSEEDRTASMRFFLREATRFAPQVNKEDEGEEEPRHYSEPEGLRECIDDLKEEISELEEKNSLRREMNALMVARNTLTEEGKLLKEGMLTAEEEWGFLLRDESPPTTRIRELEEETEKLRKRAESAEDFIRERRARKVTWWRRWFLWWL